MIQKEESTLILNNQNFTFTKSFKCIKTSW